MGKVKTPRLLSGQVIRVSVVEVILGRVPGGIHKRIALWMMTDMTEFCHGGGRSLQWDGMRCMEVDEEEKKKEKERKESE